MPIPAESGDYSAPKRSLSPLPRFGRQALLAIALPSATLVVLVLLWDWAVQHYDIPSTLLARPGEVLSDFAYGVTSGIFLTHTLVTMQEVAYGFVIGAAGGFFL